MKNVEHKYEFQMFMLGNLGNLTMFVLLTYKKWSSSIETIFLYLRTELLFW